MAGSNGRVRWKDVPGFEGYYRVSSDGQVKNLKTGRLLSVRYGVTLRRDDGATAFKSPARLVLETFRGPPPSPEHVAVRLDRNFENNNLKNLAWKTRSEFPPTTKLSRRQVESIRRLAQRGVRGAEIARRYGVTRQNVHSILKRRRWAA